MKRIHIFKAGKHTCSQGQSLSFTEDHLKASVDAYDPDLHEAPIVVGHPKGNAPAWGWVSSLNYNEDGLTANPNQVDAEFEELVQAGRFKKVSASFYPPDSANNPVPGVFYLRHVGFLGAQPPAIKGLKGVDFAEDEEVVEFSASFNERWDTSNIANLFRKLREFFIDKYSKEEADDILPSWTIEELENSGRRTLEAPDKETNPAFKESNPKKKTQTEGTGMTEEELKQQQADLDAREQALKDKETSFSEKQAAVKATEAALAKKEIEAELGDLVKAGKLVPAQKGMLADFMASLDDEKDVVEFGEGDNKKSLSQRDFMREFLSKLPKAVDFEEHGKGDQEEPPENSNALAARALEYQEAERKKGRTVSISQAVFAIQKGKE